jgi:hypothetical protein
LVGGGRAWLASRLSPASVHLVGVVPLSVKQPLEEFRRLRRLGLPTVESSAGCWRSRPFGRSRPSWPNVVEIPGTSADRWLCPWPTRIVIPTTATAASAFLSFVASHRSACFLVSTAISTDVNSFFKALAFALWLAAAVGVGIGAAVVRVGIGATAVRSTTAVSSIAGYTALGAHRSILGALAEKSGCCATGEWGL